MTPGTVTAVVLVVALLGALVVDQWTSRTARRIVDGNMLGTLSPARSTLQNAINERMALLQGVAAYAKTHWDGPEFDAGFDAYAAQIASANRVGIRSIQYVVDGVIRHAWPEERNAQAVGRNLLQDVRPEIAGDLQEAIIRGTIVLSGPTDLYQGGRGLIGRLRISLPDTAPAVVAAIVLDLPSVLAEARLQELEGVHWWLRDHRRQTIAASVDDTTLFAGAPPLVVRLPDREWQLLAAPLTGWAAAVAAQQRPFRAASAIVVLLLTLLAWSIASWQSARLDVERTETRRRADEKFQLLFTLVPDGVVVVRDADGRIIECNEAFSTLAGRPRRALLGAEITDAGLWASTTERDALLAKLQQDGSLSDERIGIGRPDGVRREGMVTATRVVIDSETCYLAIFRDVHDRLLLERRVSEGQRLEAIGRLAGGVAHDFNNLVTGIGGYVALALDDMPPDHPLRSDLLEIQRASGRAADLTRQLLTFARRQVVAPRVADLNELVRETQGFLVRLVGEAVVLTVEPADEPVHVLIDPTQFEQVLTNLAINARDAMPEGGTLRIAIRREAELAILEVHDTGIGIPADSVPHLFEPFYTTKPQGQGTGLGLATVYGIIQQAGGRIDVRSTPGEGTTFTIAFPRRREGPTRRTTPVPTELPTGEGQILVVEDEPQVRDLTRRVLERLGYQVVTAPDGLAAMALLDQGARPTLILTDMVMPGMGGGELARTLAQRPEAPRMLLMSGYSEELIKAEHQNLPFLAKPFTPAELARAVRDALDA